MESGTNAFMIDINDAATRPAPELAASEPRSQWLPIAFLVGANLVPVVGLLEFDWDLAQIMVLFWAENGVIGFYTLLKLAVIERWRVIFRGAFFVLHYGVFMTVHFLFVNQQFVRPSGEKVPELFAALWPALLAIFVSYGVSFFTGFMGRREYVGRTATQQMNEPYPRLMVLHVTLIAGAMVATKLGQPLYSLLVLVACKFGIELRAQLRAARAAEQAPSPM